MSWFGWVRVAVVALLSAALGFLAPTFPAAAAPGDITLTGTISSISGAQFREVSIHHYARRSGASEFFTARRILHTYVDLAVMWVDLMVGARFRGNGL